MVIWPEASNAQNTIAAVSAEGSLRLDPGKIAPHLRTNEHCLGCCDAQLAAATGPDACTAKKVWEPHTHKPSLTWSQNRAGYQLA